ncbi:hypothetical protein F53441_7437 [Fusarium austroafricanum]|uniref:Uncharacterized protein n=1 Tax=Fusarium austroafricanum TaxID=2364996 RepID=A0A8H4KDH3_9HYPO|nr:hypothetical protein F53441_7437 [Fusarium austroafricanum]
MTQEPEEPEVSDNATKFWVTRLLAITQEPPKDITPYLQPGTSLPVVETNQKRSKSTITSMIKRDINSALAQDPTDVRVKNFKERAFAVGFRKLTGGITFFH